MECERLQRLVKNWYAQVQDEAMAPARMVAFMESHIAECQTCLADPLVRGEVDKIIALIMPSGKNRKTAVAAEEETKEPPGQQPAEGAAAGTEDPADNDEDDEI